ncbi:hypothetical protein DPSP01_010271 [Paraphaeosphaeria sporulosa]
MGRSSETLTTTEPWCGVHLQIKGEVLYVCLRERALLGLDSSKTIARAKNVCSVEQHTYTSNITNQNRRANRDGWTLLQIIKDRGYMPGSAGPQNAFCQHSCLLARGASFAST